MLTVTWAVAFAGLAVADQLWLVSEGIPGDTPSGGAVPVAMSYDGEWVVLQSTATSLLPGLTDGNGAEDLFLWRRTTGELVLVTHAAGSTTTTANGGSYSANISYDGAWVAFVSNATDLVAGGSDTNGDYDVFLWERATGEVTLVSHAAGDPGSAVGGRIGSAALSSYEPFLAFVSSATNLVAGVTDGNGGDDVFLYQHGAGTSLVSHQAGAPLVAANGTADPYDLPQMNADGTHVVFVDTAANLVTGGSDTNGAGDVFRWQLADDTLTLVSHSAVGVTTAGNGASALGDVASDGAYVLFQSNATDLVAGGSDTNGVEDVFLWEASGDVTLISHRYDSETTTGNGRSYAQSLSADGGWVALSSAATDLVDPGAFTDGNNTHDVFAWQRISGSMVLVSHVGGNDFTAGSGFSNAGPWAWDIYGDYLLLWSWASDLVNGGSDTNGQLDVLQWTLWPNSAALASRTAASPTTAQNGAAGPGLVSAEGRWVAFGSTGTDLVAGITDTNGAEDAFLWDRSTTGLVLISQISPAAVAGGNDSSGGNEMSPDGRFVAFTSNATNLLAGFVDANGASGDAFLWDRQSGTVLLASHAAGASATGGNGYSDPHGISDDGRYVLLQSYSTDLVSPLSDLNNEGDVFLWDRDTDTTTLVSHRHDSATTTGSGRSYPLGLSADGRYAIFWSYATDLVAGVTDGNGAVDAFLWDRDTGGVTLISRQAAAPTATASGYSQPERISADGRWVVFGSNATDLVLGQVDGNGGEDAFLWDRTDGSVRLLSHLPGSPVTTGNGLSWPRALTGDGAHVLYWTQATDLVAGGTDTNNEGDLVQWSQAGDTATLVSHTAGSPETAANGNSDGSAMSADGEYVAFSSGGTDLVGGITDGNDSYDAFLWQRTGSVITLVSATAGGAATGNSGSWASAIDATGDRVAFGSSASDLVGGGTDLNGREDVFVWRRPSGTVALVSHRAGFPLTAAGGSGESARLGSDGAYLMFNSSATDLMAGDFSGENQVYLWAPDTTPPGNPTSLASTDHTPGVWSADRTVSMQWSGASDTGGSGLAGYSVLFDTASATIPDTVVDVVQASDPHETTSAELADGAAHYFHLRTCDGDENCTSPLHDGPYRIDGTPPSAPGPLTSSHDGAPRADVTIDVAWGAASDALSQVDGYSFFFDGLAASGCETTKDVEESTLAAVSSPLADGAWYFHVCAVDQAGNWGETAHGGPYVVDTTAPIGLAVESASHTVETWSADATIDFSFSDAIDANGVTGYSLVFDREAGTEPDATPEQPGTSYVGTASPDGTDWRIHVRACDAAGNCGATVHLGAFWIDTTPPGPPAPTSSSHTVGVPSSDTTVDVSWSAPSESGSGIDGYGFIWTGSSGWTCDEVKDVEETTLATVSPVLGDGSWHFHLCAVDEAGNWGPVGHGGPYLIDTTAPTGLVVESTSHAVETWSTDATIEFAFSGASDANGVTGYSLTFDREAGTDPDATPEQPGTSYVGAASPDAADWRIHVRACDAAGNCGATVHLGAFWIDSTPPEAPAPTSSSHTAGVPSPDTTVDVSWSAPLESGSGIDGYGFAWTGSGSWTCDEVKDVEEAATATTSPVLAAGSWTFHLCARDNAGLWSAVGHAGPFVIDLAAPRVTGVATVRDTGDGVLAAGESTTATVTQLLVTFDEPMADPPGHGGIADVTNVANWRVVSAGANGALETADCAGLSGDDGAVALAAVVYEAGARRAAVQPSGVLGLALANYRLIACPALTDEAGNGLDGDGDGTAGDPFRRDFHVALTNLLENPNFDPLAGGGLDPWTVVEASPGDVQWASADAGGATTSGSAELVTAAGAGQTWAVAQCRAVTAGQLYQGALRARIDSATPGAPEVSLTFDFFDGAGCTGGNPGTATTPVAAGDTGGQWLLRAPREIAAPAGAQSVRYLAIVSAGAADAFTVDLDDPLFGLDGELLTDDFEGGDASLWSGCSGCGP